MTRFLIIKAAQPSDFKLAYQAINLDNLLSIAVYKRKNEDGLDARTQINLVMNYDETYYKFVVMESPEAVVDGIQNDDKPVLRQSKFEHNGQ